MHYIYIGSVVQYSVVGVFGLMILILLVTILVCTFAQTSLMCPYERAKDSSSFLYFNSRSNSNHSNLVLCLSLSGKALDIPNIAFLSELSHAHTHSAFQILLRKDNESMSHCSVIAVLSDMPISDIYDKRSLCPGTCLPVPKVSLSNELIFQSSYANLFDLHKDIPITCSLTLDMIHRRRQKVENLKASKRHDVTLFLKELFFRKIYECYESVKIPKRLHHHNSNSLRSASDYDHLPRRKIKALIIWIGSMNNIQLIRDQLQVIQGQPNAGIDAVVTWAATDEIYNCNENTTQCFGGNGKYKYLPHSAMNVNKFGWKCAQRRPLRALAHTLLLFDPSFAVVLDDDTYLNYPLLVDKFGSYLFNDMLREPIYVGEFLGKTGVNGHLSTEGIFAGGAGYLLGQRLLQILHSKEIIHFGFEFGESTVSRRAKGDLSDRYRSDQQIRHLSLLSEGLQTACNGVEFSILLRKANETKISLISNRSSDEQMQMFIPISVRLIDYCTNLMANEHACHHSDHSFGRCMLYGAYATPVGAACHSTGSASSIVTKNAKVGFCFMTPTCDINEQVTCHRYRATLSTPTDKLQHQLLLPVRNTHIKGYFRMYSSVFDGNSSDSYA